MLAVEQHQNHGGDTLRKSQSTTSLRKRAHTVPQAPQPRPNHKISNPPPNGNTTTTASSNGPPALHLHVPQPPKEKLRRRLSISSLPSPQPNQQVQKLSLWNYFLRELTSSGDTIYSEDKTEQLLNVIKVPAYLEKVVFFGVLACSDAFLYLFTILPIRFVYSVYRLFKVGGRQLSHPRRGDILRGLIFLSVATFLLYFDTSKIYHSIRGQAAIKLYVMFSVFEIGDKLCSALGQDIMEAVCSPTSMQKSPKYVLFVFLAIAYCCVHASVLLYQVVTLNVAVNSYSNALLTLLLSNQFSEIKSAVFKKFERENLFQLACADITERFQLLAMLLAIGTRNVVEVSTIGVIPNSWAGWNRWLGALFGPALVVVSSELMVDWLKHAYVAKFNNIRPQVYNKFLDVLALDYAENAFSDQIMTKRIGLPTYPLGAVFVRMLIQSYSIFAENAVARASSPSSSSPSLTPNSGSRTSLASAASPSARSALEKVDDFLKANVASPAYFTMNFVLLLTVTFVGLLLLKLILGSSLHAYTLKRYIKIKQRRASSSSSGGSSDFVPGRDKFFGTIELDETMRTRLYQPEEEPPKWREKKQTPSDIADYWSVTRFKMVAKRIW